MHLLTPPDVRRLCAELGVRPTKTLGQNFVHDAGTVRAIAAAADLGPGSRVIEVGPGLGSLTLALLETGAHVHAVEIDPTLARALPATIAEFAPDAAHRFSVQERDALTITGLAELAAIPGPTGISSPPGPDALVANLPYNVAVPVLLTLLGALPSLRTAVVMVQAEVADRIAARPGSRIYGVPSVKCQWYGTARRIRSVGRSVFWPVPNVDSAVVKLEKYPDDAAPASLPHAQASAITPGQASAITPGPASAITPGQASAITPGRASAITPGRDEVFAVVDAAFAQRRKTLRAALGPWAGSPARAEDILRTAGIDPRTRGEQLTITEFAAIAAAASQVPGH